MIGAVPKFAPVLSSGGPGQYMCGRHIFFTELIKTNWVSSTQLVDYNRLLFHKGGTKWEMYRVEIWENNFFLSPPVIGV